MGAQTQVTQRTNAATPLSRDIIGMLRAQLTGEPSAAGGPQAFGVGGGGGGAGGGGGQFGLGVGPMQQEAGTAMRQFVDAINRRVTGAGNFEGEQFDAIRDIQRQNRQESLADVREGFGAAGNVAGSGVGFAQSQVLRDLIPRQEREFANIRRQEEEGLMRAIMGLQQIGQQNVDPFFQMASAGLMSPHVSQRESPWVTLLGGLAGGASGAGNLIQGLRT